MVTAEEREIEAEAAEVAEVAVVDEKRETGKRWREKWIGKRRSGGGDEREWRRG